VVKGENPSKVSIFPTCLILPGLESKYKDLIKTANTIVIINTFIPNLDDLKTNLIEALNKHSNTHLELYLLNPKSEITHLRTQSLMSYKDPAKTDIVRTKTVINLNSIASWINDGLINQNNIKLVLFDSAPSFSVYRADNYYSLGLFAHGRLAINSPQFVITNNEPIISDYIKQEINYLTGVGIVIRDITKWHEQIEYKLNGQ
jgi:hypothetical protein